MQGCQVPECTNPGVTVLVFKVNKQMVVCSECANKLIRGDFLYAEWPRIELLQNPARRHAGGVDK